MGCGASKKKEEETQDRDQQNDGQVKEKTDEGAAGAGAGDKSSSDMEDSNSSAMGDSNSSDVGDSNSSEMGESNSSGVSDDASGDDDDKKNARKEKREAKAARKEERKAKREGKVARKEERKAKREGKAAREEERKEKREGKAARKEERRVKREGKAERKEARQAKKREEKAAEEKAAEEKAAEEEKKQEEEPKKEEEPAAGDENKKEEETPAVAPAPAVEKKDNSARKSMWDELREKLPTEKKNKEQRKARKALFNTFDPNGNGYLSVAECDLGFRSGDMKLDDLTDDLAPILMRAFNQAKGVRQAKGKGKKQGEDYVEKPEFRLLLVYLKQYFELWFMFDEIDSGDDRRVNQEEFNKAVPKLAEWGVAIDDSEAAFKEIDTNDGGIVLFTEFAEWAIKKGLELEDADSSSEDKDD